MHAVSSAPSLLTALRGATHDAHQALDRRLDLHQLTSTRDRYVRLLRATLAVMAPLESRVAASLAPQFDWSADVTSDGPPQRSARLRHDLDALGHESAVLPLDGVPDVTDPARAFGVAYVLQGSQLGGAVIARQLLQHGQATSEQTTYLRLYGDALGRVWHRFIERLDDCGASFGPPEWQAAIEAAQQTFAAFDRALTREGVA